MMVGSAWAIVGAARGAGGLLLCRVAFKKCDFYPWDIAPVLVNPLIRRVFHFGS
jgi:hypothetical protein